MGFRDKKSLKFAEEYVKRSDLDGLEARNLRHWVQRKKSEVVNLLIGGEQK